MTASLPDLPTIDWFELEILYFLLEKERYGNELLSMLNQHMGNVSSGKLYSDLKKMEKKGSIIRVKRKRLKGEGMLTRGVDRVYFEITDTGKEELRKVERYMTGWQFQGMLERSSLKIPGIIETILKSKKDGMTVGVAVDPSKMGISRAMNLLPEIENVNYVLLLISSDGNISSIPPVDTGDREMTIFPSADDDIPLKGEYLDAVISLYPLSKVKKVDTYIEELVRVLRTGSKLALVDFSRIESFILEDIFRDQLDSPGSNNLNDEEIATLLENYLDRFHIEKFKEQFIAWGRKV